jgi:hypothetical protein
LASWVCNPGFNGVSFLHFIFLVLFTYQNIS